MSEHTIQSDICIIGSGAIGKTAALALSQAGLRVSLVSPASIPSTQSDDWDVRVFALNHIAFNLLDSLKVWDALDASRVAPVLGMKVADASTDANGHIHFDAYGARTEELAWILEDRNLNNALDNALRFAQRVQGIDGEACALNVTQDNATVTLSDGQTIVASLVVGADGAQSWVRAQCEIDVDYRSYGQKGVVTNFSCEFPHQGIAHQWFVEDQGIIALLPLPNQQVSLVWSAPNALADNLMREPLANLVERLQPYAASVLGRLTPLQPELVKAFPLNFIRPQSLIAARVALIGDAAHAVHPLAGHGMNLGFGDVHDLVQTMTQREEHRDCGDPRVLRRYQRARREDVALMQFTTDGLARLFGSELGAVRSIRNMGLNLLDQFPLIKRKLISHAMGSSSR